MIGANDFFVCEETTADQCSSLTEQAGVLAAVGKNVKTILSAIRNKAHYGGQIAIVNYYWLDYSSQTQDGQSALLDATQDTAAKPFHVVVADGFGQLEAGSAHSGGNTCTAGLITQLSTGGCGSIRATPGRRCWRSHSRRRSGLANQAEEAIEADGESPNLTRTSGP